MLDFDPTRTPVAPRPAATIILLRDPPPASPSAHGGEGEVEICLMQRSTKSSFMGGAVVFPGGRIEPHDGVAVWGALLGSQIERATGPWWDDEGIAARVAACREALEEVGLLPLVAKGYTAPCRVSAESLTAIRGASARGGEALRDAVAEAGWALDLARLVPLSRWLTPEAESRRFDARFFLARAPEGQVATSDDHEATRVSWATPTALLRDFDAGAITLFPPTHRTLELLKGRATVEDALRLAVSASLEVICPRFAMADGTPTLALPGDPLHEIRERRILGASRYVLRDARWVSEEASPSTATTT